MSEGQAISLRELATDGLVDQSKEEHQILAWDAIAILSFQSRNLGWSILTAADAMDAQFNHNSRLQCEEYFQGLHAEGLYGYY